MLSNRSPVFPRVERAPTPQAARGVTRGHTSLHGVGGLYQDSGPKYTPRLDRCHRPACYDADVPPTAVGATPSMLECTFMLQRLSLIHI